MSLDEDSERLRDVINGCIGYRVLDDDDVIRPSDETARGSTLLSGNEAWFAMDDEFKTLFGLTVSDANDREHNDEMDAEERLFRRRL